MKSLKYFFLILLFPTHLLGEVLKHEVSSPKNYEFDFRDACLLMGSKNLELISAKSMTEIDCTGKVFRGVDFCMAKFPLEQELTRGIVDEKRKKVICETAPSVSLTLSCDARSMKYCIDHKRGCEELKKYMQRNWKLFTLQCSKKKLIVILASIKLTNS